MEKYLLDLANVMKCSTANEKFSVKGVVDGAGAGGFCDHHHSVVQKASDYIVVD